MKKLCDLLIEALEAAPGVSEDQARTLAAHIIEHGAQAGAGGSEIYWPTRYRPLSGDELRAEVSAAWRGNNASEVCDRFQISRATLYRCLRAQDSPLPPVR